MEYLILKCECGNEKKFTGKDVEEIIMEMKKSGWNDYYDPYIELPKGYHTGICSECMKGGLND